MRDWAGLGARVLRNGDLAESAVLAPATFAEAEATVLAATTGPHGVLPESLGWEADAMLVRVTVRALQEADDLVHGSFEVLDHLLGRAVGVSLISSLPLLAGAAATAGPPALLAWRGFRRRCGASWPGTRAPPPGAGSAATRHWSSTWSTAAAGSSTACGTG